MGLDLTPPRPPLRAERGCSTCERFGQTASANEVLSGRHRCDTILNTPSPLGEGTGVRSDTMTESEWLTSDDGERMLALVENRLSFRKFVILGGDDPAVLADEEECDKIFARHRRYGVGYELTTLASVLREQLGNPFRPYPFDPRWRTETVVALASAIEADRAFDRMPILADALEEAGCDWPELLAHCRDNPSHAPGCWVLDLILDREPELFALPPLVPTPRRMRLGPFTPPPEGMA